MPLCVLCLILHQCQFKFQDRFLFTFMSVFACEFFCQSCVCVCVCVWNFTVLGIKTCKCIMQLYMPLCVHLSFRHGWKSCQVKSVTRLIMHFASQLNLFDQIRKNSAQCQQELETKIMLFSAPFTYQLLFNFLRLVQWEVSMSKIPTEWRVFQPCYLWDQKINLWALFGLAFFF